MFLSGVCRWGRERVFYFDRIRLSIENGGVGIEERKERGDMIFVRRDFLVSTGRVIKVERVIRFLFRKGMNCVSFFGVFNKDTVYSFIL